MVLSPAAAGCETPFPAGAGLAADGTNGGMVRLLKERRGQVHSDRSIEEEHLWQT